MCEGCSQSGMAGLRLATTSDGARTRGEETAGIPARFLTSSTARPRMAARRATLRVVWAARELDAAGMVVSGQKPRRGERWRVSPTWRLTPSAASRREHVGQDSWTLTRPSDASGLVQSLAASLGLKVLSTCSRQEPSVRSRTFHRRGNLRSRNCPALSRPGGRGFADWAGHWVSLQAGDGPCIRAPQLVRLQCRRGCVEAPYPSSSVAS